MGSSLTIGVFDGVHRGHQALVAETVARAAGEGLRSLVVTFDPNPLEVLRPQHAPTRLCSLSKRLQLLTALGVDQVEVLSFDDAMSQMTAEEFVDQVLLERFGAEQVVIGANFRFGNKAAGSAETIRRAGCAVHEFALTGEGDDPISSTRIRQCVAAGSVEIAASLLGRQHSVTGVVGHGLKRGRVLGYPTANLVLHPLTAIPADGVYAGRAHWRHGQAVAAISVGSNPTFGGVARTVEAYLLDFDDDLYDMDLTVEFAHRLRPMSAFESTDALIGAMRADVSQTRDLMGSESAG